MAVKASAFSGNVLNVSRRFYDGKVGSVKSKKAERHLPLHPQLVERMRALGDGHDWIFHSREGTPVIHGNVLKRYVRPALKELGIELGGWHDFRHNPKHEDAEGGSPSKSRF